MKRKRDTSSAGGDGSETLGAEFEVFLSFRGPDTGLTFTDCLYHSMVRAWIHVFRDAEEIRIGEEIGGELLRAINSSKIYMPIFSRNYASSAWCLRELAYMLECWRKRTSEKMIIPIFYDVDPDDVKLKTGLYFEALERHGDKFGCDQVQRWKEALIEVARIKGWHLRDQGHGKIINLIIDEVLTKLTRGKRNLPDHIVGFHDHVEAIINILDEGSRDILCLVIHGMGGIDGGKIVELQQKLLSEILHLKSIEIVDDDRLWMHNQLRDLGREIVRQEDVKMPENRSRLWLPKNALDVVQNRKGTNNVVALKLTPIFEEHSFTSEGFSKLPNLRLLELEGVGFVGDFRNIFSKVAWLSWRFCPLEFRATNLCFNNLAVLKLSNSDISEDWAGWGPCLANKNLKVIHLTKCTTLRRTPNFSNCSKLKILVIKDCTHLLVVDSSISKLELLKYLEVSGYSHWIPEACEEKDFDLFAVSSVLGGLKSLSTLKIERMCVRELHHSIGELVGLKCLSLVGCRMLRKLPNSIGNMRSLLELDLDDTGIIELPNSIGDLKMLKKMSLAMTRLKELPNSIGGLESLLELVLDQTHILELPASIGNLTRLELLHLSWSQIRELSRGIWMLVNLEELDARGCQNLEGEIPSEIRELSFLRMLDLSWTKVRRLPTAMKQLSCLHELFLQGCDELEWLPELPPSLTMLEFSSESSRTIPDLSNLTNLVRLDIFGGIYQSSKFTKVVCFLVSVVQCNYSGILILLANISYLSNWFKSWPDSRQAVLYKDSYSQPSSS
ncbi:disease resistance protein RPV1-like [Eucalyptus grandis]|uniref:disease resistance protein RPV1-like n=1 Tax=Eucalyptus grandis TaxID=71139 RepID=UPI00192F07D2|nr:disease resistance protein RPV1-like [Eucalyptus grandis]